MTTDALVDLSNLQVAIADFVRAVARHHDGLPVEDAVVLLIPAGRRSVHGYFASDRWEGVGSRPVHEIAVVADHLDEGLDELADTILHELIHLFEHATGARPPSRQGRYHSRAFAELAIEFGLHVAKDPHVGHRTVGLRDEARIRYHNELEALRAALVLVRRELRRESDAPSGEGDTELTDTQTRGEPPRRRAVVAHCQCTVGRARRRQIRVPIEGWETDSIECRVCGTPFIEVEKEGAL